MGAGPAPETRRRLREKILVRLRRAGTRVEYVAKNGAAVRYLIGSAVEFLVEDSCAICRRSHGSRRDPPAAVPDPAGMLLEPVDLRFLRGALTVQNRPVCAFCARELVAARAAGVLGRRVGEWGIATEIGGIFGETAPEGGGGPGPGGEGAREAADGWSGPPIQILSPFMTTTPVLHLVHLLKFGGYKGLAGPLARTMAWAVRRFAEPTAGDPLLVPIPMDDRALRRRGFSHTERLARELSAVLGYPVGEVLRKTARTRPQSKTPNRDRASNVRNAFACGPGDFEPGGRPLYLVDDLVTTGATAAACGAVLLRGGARSVTVVCFGRAM